MAATRALTAKQTVYRDARLSGLGPSDAYRAAYDAERMSPKAISVNAAKLEKHTSIALAITSARTATVERIERRLQRSAEDIARKRWEIIDDPETATGDVLTALRDESKRYAEYSDKIDSRVLHGFVELPPGTTLADIDARIAALKGAQ